MDPVTAVSWMMTLRITVPPRPRARLSWCLSLCAPKVVSDGRWTPISQGAPDLLDREPVAVRGKNGQTTGATDCGDTGRATDLLHREAGPVTCRLDDSGETNGRGLGCHGCSFQNGIGSLSSSFDKAGRGVTFVISAPGNASFVLLINGNAE